MAMDTRRDIISLIMPDTPATDVMNRMNSHFIQNDQAGWELENNIRGLGSGVIGNKIELDYSGMTSNKVKFLRDVAFNVGGYSGVITAGTEVTADAPPVASTRTDLLFLEAYLEETTGKTESYGTNYRDYTLADTSTKLVFRLRYEDGINFSNHPNGLCSYGTGVATGDYSAITVQGGNVAPLARAGSDFYTTCFSSNEKRLVITADNIVGKGDVGLYSAGEVGDATYKSSFKSFDGCVYALPLFIITRVAGQSSILPYDVQDIAYYIGRDNNDYEIFSDGVIDGAFEVCQKETTKQITSTRVLNGNLGAYVTFDAWKTFLNNSNPTSGKFPTITVSRAESNSTAPYVYMRESIKGLRYMARIENGTGLEAFSNNACHDFVNYIEGGTRRLCGRGRKVTVSFWARAKAATQKIGLYLVQNYGNDGTGTKSADETIIGNNWTLATGWRRYSHTFYTNTLESKSFTENDYLAVCFRLAWTSGMGAAVNSGSAYMYANNDYVEIAGVQIDAGDIARPFRLISYETSLKKVQRYYKCWSYENTRIVDNLIVQQTVGTNYVYWPFRSDVDMRRTLETGHVKKSSLADFRLVAGNESSPETILALDGSTSDTAAWFTLSNASKRGGLMKMRVSPTDPPSPGCAEIWTITGASGWVEIDQRF